MPDPAYTLETFTARDGYAWRYRRYRTTGTPKAEVVFIHGIQSHGGWYERSCTELCQAGFNVSFLDRRGAGLNEAQRGDAPGFRRLLDDIAEFLTVLPRTAPQPGHGVAKLPLFLGAISWGGKLGVALERRHPGLVDGLMLLCPGFYPKVRPSLGQRLLILLSRLFRRRKLFAIPLRDPELFTGNPRWQQFIREDPLSLRQATARFLFESVRLDGYLRFAAKYVHVPVLLLLAEHDRIIRNAKTRGFIDRLAAKDKTIIEYPGAHHTLEFEPDPEQFIVDMRAWLEKHLEAPNPG